jgi:predicted GIY-YIG superfamily endonuclease
MKLIGFTSLDWNIRYIYMISLMDKFYIGRSKNLRKRIGKHMWEWS